MTKTKKDAIIKAQDKKRGKQNERVLEKKKNLRNYLTETKKGAIIKAQGKKNKSIKKKKEVLIMTKMTYAVALDVAIKAVGEGEVADKLTTLKAQLAKKSSGERKPTATQKENAGFKDAILEGIGDGKYTITEIMKAVPAVSELSNQRVSALVRQMQLDGLLVREEVKRKAYFSKA